MTNELEQLAPGTDEGEIPNIITAMTPQHQSSGETREVMQAAKAEVLRLGWRVKCYGTELW